MTEIFIFKLIINHYLRSQANFCTFMNRNEQMLRNARAFASYEEMLNQHDKRNNMRVPISLVLWLLKIASNYFCVPVLMKRKTRIHFNKTNSICSHWKTYVGIMFAAMKERCDKKTPSKLQLCVQHLEHTSAIGSQGRKKKK